MIDRFGLFFVGKKEYNRCRNKREESGSMEQMKQQGNPLGYAPLGGLMRKFAIPSIISMLVNSLYNMTDQIFIGHKIGMLGNAATNVAFPVTMLLIAFAQLIGVGTAANFNISLGAKRMEDAKKYRSFKKSRNLELKRTYYCPVVKGLCKLQKCSNYESCDKQVKKHYMEWKSAYRNNNKELLMKLK